MARRTTPEQDGTEAEPGVKPASRRGKSKATKASPAKRTQGAKASEAGANDPLASEEAFWEEADTPDPAPSEQSRFDLAALGLLTLSGMAALTLELRAILEGISPIWAGTRLAGLPLVASVVFAILFAVSLLVARRIGRIWALFCTVPFLVMATLPLLTPPPPEGTIAYRTVVPPVVLPPPDVSGSFKVQVPGATREDVCYLVTPEGDLVSAMGERDIGYDPELGWRATATFTPDTAPLTVTCVRLAVR